MGSRFADLHGDVTGLRDASRIRLDAAFAVERPAGGKIELPGVQRADQYAPAHKSIGEGAAAVRALCLRREDPPFPCAENGDPAGAGIERSAFALWYGS
jgi:hypothetical protein